MAIATPCAILYFLARPVVNIAVNKIDILWVRYHYSRDRATIVGHCDVINSRLWRQQQNENRASETRGRCVNIVVLSSFVDSLCRERKQIMYVLPWWIVSALIRERWNSSSLEYIHYSLYIFGHFISRPYCISWLLKCTIAVWGVLWWRHQMEAFFMLLALCAGIHRWPVNSPHKG